MDTATGRSDRLNDYAPALVLAVAVLVGFLAAWVIGPGGPPVPVDRPAAERTVERADPAGSARAGQYRSRSRELALASLAVQFGVLAFLVLYRGRPVRNLLDRASSRPVRGAAGIGALLALVLAAAGLPVAYLSFEHGRDYGLITQSLGGWLGDQLLSTAISVAISAVLATTAYLAWRRFRQRFWIAASALAIALALVWIWLWPVAIAPLFNRFDPLPAGAVRSEVIRLADRAGVEVDDVYTVDASRRSVALNAYVNGIGSSKRVVIYDNAIDQLTPRQLSALIAHELVHVEAHDVYRGLAFAVLVIPLGALAMQLFAGATLRRRGEDRSSPAVVLPLALGLAVVTLVLTVPGNLLSRQIELNADYESVTLTGDPAALEGLQLRLAGSNLSDPDPPAAWQFLFGTHPSTVDRLALAEGMRGAGSTP
jgi:STE24 endopeptidase